jgi:hypothetical protein
MGILAVLGRYGVVVNDIAVAIAVTSTALGTLLPMLRDHGLPGTSVGSSVRRHGGWGELGPVVAIAALLGARGPALSLAIPAAFALVAVLLALPALGISAPAVPHHRPAGAFRRGDEWPDAGSTHGAAPHHPGHGGGGGPPRHRAGCLRRRLHLPDEPA